MAKTIFEVEVVTVPIGANEPSDTGVVNFHHPQTREWFVNHCFWAVHNNHQVGIRAVDGVAKEA